MTEHMVFLITGGHWCGSWGSCPVDLSRESQNFINTATRYRAERKSLPNAGKEKLWVRKSSNKEGKIGNKVLSTKISSYWRGYELAWSLVSKTAGREAEQARTGKILNCSNQYSLESLDRITKASILGASTQCSVCRFKDWTEEWWTPHCLSGASIPDA